MLLKVGGRYTVSLGNGVCSLRSRAGFLSKQISLTGHPSLSIPVLDFPSRKKTMKVTPTLYCFVLVVAFGPHQPAYLLVIYL